MFRAVVVGVVLLALLAAGGVVGARRLLDSPGPLPEARDVVVPRGSITQLGAALTDAGVVARPLPFQLAVWLTWRDGPLRAAEFAFPAHASLRTVLTVLRTGKPVQHLLTIPEGLTAKQIAALLDRAEALTGSTPLPPEGSVLPQTYAYERGTTRAALLARAQAAMTRALASAWADRAPDLPIDSPAEALTLASIVERETAKPEERAHVAAVYLNRLRIGMKLQADPTVVYAASGGLGVLDRKLSRADLDRDDPYNTYRIAGLPPGPIASPGLATLQAVLHPATSDDLYFVADGTGGHVFARTLEAHARNVAAWRALTAPAHASD
ncbi:MAG: endolytic transglycosylase MltG [Rhodospirillales bacterium]|nr:endolytic transglycosylase MltG [Rhodospirillales bacterium]